MNIFVEKKKKKNSWNVKWIKIKRAINKINIKRQFNNGENKNRKRSNTVRKRGRLRNIKITTRSICIKRKAKRS